MVNEMFCSNCGNKLEKKFLLNEGMINFCSNCNDFIFDKTNVAVSMIILNPDETKILYIKQYGTGKFRLVAGYTNKGESLEHTVYREMGEEIGRYPSKIEFNMSKYYEPSNTLISNFICHLTSEKIFPNEEIDSYEWIDIKDAKIKIRHAKLASVFVNEYLEKIKK